MTSIRSAVSGEPMTLDAFHGAPPASIAELRSAVALALGIGVKGVALMRGGGARVEDEEDLMEDFEQQLSYAVAWGPLERLAPHLDRSESVRLIAVRDFPEPQGIQINMMPFIMGEKGSIPREYQHYWDMISACECYEHGKVGFLTIQESLVPKGVSQRRPGLHVDMAGVMARPGSFQEGMMLHWGLGRASPHIWGGIFMASSVANSCEVWDARIEQPEQVLGRLGDAEHFRELLGEGMKMKRGGIYWISDVTPHESLPLETGTFRQYFRLVTSEVAVWYAQHSTPNRLGIEPDPEKTRILLHDKFSGVPQFAQPAAPVEPFGEEFEVTLDDYDEEHDLGLRVYVEPSAGQPSTEQGSRLMVRYVEDGGIVDRWNQANPERQVRAKSQILAVNGLDMEMLQHHLEGVRKTGRITGWEHDMKVRTLLVVAARPPTV